MADESLIAELVTLIDLGASPEDLAGSAARESVPRLYARAEEAYGSWEAFLAQSVVAVRRRARQRGSFEAAAAEVEEPQVERVVGDDADLPLVVCAAGGGLARMDLDELEARAAPRLAPWPEGPAGARPERVLRLDEHPSLVLLTGIGRAARLDRRMLPAWEPDADLAQGARRLTGLEPGEDLALALNVRDLERHGRYYGISRRGQVKVTDSADLAKRLEAEPNIALLLKEGDALEAFICGHVDARLFVASSDGHALVFDTEALRSQGRRATGVRAIALPEGGSVVGAFAVQRVGARAGGISMGSDAWLGLITEQGFAKRVRVDEFRPQGRGGGGLQTCRLGSGDEVAKVAPVVLAEDVLVLTSAGRYARFPAAGLPSLGRPARGERIVDLDIGEQVVDLVGVPAGEIEGLGGVSEGVDVDGVEVEEVVEEVEE